MNLFKKTPAKMWKSISPLLRAKDGKTHVLVDVEPTNSMTGINDRVNGVYDAMREHGYQIVKMQVTLHLKLQTSIVIIYK